MSPLVRTLATFAVVQLVLQTALYVFGMMGFSAVITEPTAAVTATLAQAVGLPVTLSGSALLLPARTLAINLECSAIFICATYLALVVASPGSVRSKAIAAASGIGVLLVANLARLVAVTWVAERLPSMFDSVHDFLFQIVMVLLSAGLWALWLSRDRRHVA